MNLTFISFEDTFSYSSVQFCCFSLVTLRAVNLLEQVETVLITRLDQTVRDELVVAYKCVSKNIFALLYMSGI